MGTNARHTKLWKFALQNHKNHEHANKIKIERKDDNM